MSQGLHILTSRLASLVRSRRFRVCHLWQLLSLVHLPPRLVIPGIFHGIPTRADELNNVMRGLSNKPVVCQVRKALRTSTNEHKLLATAIRHFSMILNATIESAIPIKRIQIIRNMMAGSAVQVPWSVWIQTNMSMRPPSCECDHWTEARQPTFRSHKSDLS